MYGERRPPLLSPLDWGWGMNDGDSSTSFIKQSNGSHISEDGVVASASGFPFLAIILHRNDCDGDVGVAIFTIPS
jgi:hypothetical protein